MKRIEIIALGGPFDGVHVSDFDMDFGLSPPNRFVVQVHKTFNQAGVNSVVHIHSTLFVAEVETNRKQANEVNHGSVLPHQYWIESACESADHLKIQALYMGERDE